MTVLASEGAVGAVEGVLVYCLSFDTLLLRSGTQTNLIVYLIWFEPCQNRTQIPLRFALPAGRQVAGSACVRLLASASAPNLFFFI